MEDTSNDAPPIKASYAEYGCRVNAISVEELFDRYERYGFIYPEKRQMLAPYLDLIKQNWAAALRGGELIHWFATFDDSTGGQDAWATLGSWRSTNIGWVTQHLVSSGCTRASAAVMLGGQAVRIRDQRDRSHQNWFQPSKRMPMRVFGSLEAALGEDRSALNRCHYVEVPNAVAGASNGACRIVPWSEHHSEPLIQLARDSRGNLYAIAEELDHPDALLEAVDDLYRMVGLRRYRRIWLAYARGDDRPLAAILAYRGPLGLNFSFLENRCDLLVRQDGASCELVEDAVLSLVTTAAGAYEDFPPGAIYVTCDENARTILCGRGGRELREYAQSIWLKEGYVACYRHVERIYARFAKRQRDSTGGRP